MLVRTSNPGSADFQKHGEPELSDVVAASVTQWGESPELMGESGWSSVGAVVGATHAAELAHFREAMPRTPLLLPGYGAQGAGAADIVGAFPDGIQGALVNSSRGIAFAYRKQDVDGAHWKDASARALAAMIDEITTALSARA